LTSLFAAVSSNSVGIFDDGNKSRIISNRDQKKGQIPSRIMLRLIGEGKSEVRRSFDPSAEETLFIPRLKGG
jgi:hypothetical protein